MDLNKFTIQNKNEYYDIASKNFQNINPGEYENVNFDKVVLKSIAILIDHDFIPTPCIQIRLELCREQKNIGSYFLYVDENKEFVDEFLIVN